MGAFASAFVRDFAGAFMGAFAGAFRRKPGRGRSPPLLLVRVGFPTPSPVPRRASGARGSGARAADTPPIRRASRQAPGARTRTTRASLALTTAHANPTTVLVRPEIGAREDEIPTVRVDEIGAGEPVVFLHGLLGENDHWVPTCRELADRARCLMLEVPLLRLRGKTCSIEGVTDIVANVLEQMVGGPSTLVGNSLGGHIAQRICLERPELCKGLTLSGSSGLFERTLEKDVRHRTRDWIERKIRDLFYDPKNIPPGCVDRAADELADREATKATVKLARSAKHDHLGERLGGIRQPALLIWGKQDTVTPPRVAEEFASLLPDVRRLVWLDQCGHAPMIEHPKAFAAAIREFLDEITGATPPGAAPGIAPGAARAGAARRGA